MPDMIRIFILAPGRALRMGLRGLLAGAEGVAILGDAASPEELPVTAAAADVILLTPAAAQGNGFAAWLEGLENPPAALLLTDSVEEFRKYAAGPARAWGALPEDVSMDELTAAARAAAQGLWVAAPGLRAGLAASRISASNPLQPGAVTLTAREAEVLTLTAQGLANKQISLALGISEHTVKFHLSSVFSKLGVSNRAEAVRVGVQQGWIAL